MNRISDVTAEHLGAGGEPDGGERLVAAFRLACERRMRRHQCSETRAVSLIWNEGAFIAPMYGELTGDEIAALEGSEPAFGDTESPR